MLQRIQTIFWILTIVLLVVLMNQTIGEQMFYEEPRLVILCIFAMVLNLLTISSYTRRSRQIRLSALALFFIIVVAVLLYFIFPEEIQNGHWMPYYLLGGGVLFNIFAIIFTAKDLKVIRDSERLR